MDLKLKLIGAAVGFLFTVFVAMSIRSSSIRPTFAWLWISISAFLISIPFLEPVYKWFSSQVLGLDDARTIVYVPLIGFLLLYSFYMTLKLSEMSDRIQELITHTAILESHIDQLGGIPSRKGH